MSLFPTQAGDARLPVSVLTGFLGSGKTTLLNRMLQHPTMSGTAVVINEIGEVGLDQHFLDEADTDVVMLSNGCLCCRVMEDLEDTVSNIYSRRTQGDLPAFERLIIETTGLADPGPVLEGFLGNPMLSRCFRVASVVTAVDALHCEGQLDRYYEAVQPIALHGVHHVLHPPVALKAWPWDDRHSRMVFVTTDLARGDVAEGLHRALGIVPHPPAPTNSPVEPALPRDHRV